MKKYLFIIILLTVNYLYSQEMIDTALVQRVFMLKTLEQAREFNYITNEEFLCRMKDPGVSYFKELDSKGFYYTKFYACAFNASRKFCTPEGAQDSRLLEREVNQKIYIFALSRSNVTILNKKIYRIEGFDDIDFYELIRIDVAENNLKSKKRFLKNVYIEGVNMTLLYENYKKHKNCKR